MKIKKSVKKSRKVIPIILPFCVTADVLPKQVFPGRIREYEVEVEAGGDIFYQIEWLDSIVFLMCK